MFEKLFDTKKLVFRIWICLWIILAIMVIFKFCFNIWYPIVEDNKYILAISRFIDDNWVVKTIIMYVFYVFNTFIVINTTTNKRKFELNIYNVSILSLFIITYIIKNINNLLGVILESLIFITIIPFYNFRKNNFKIKIINLLLPIVLYTLLNLWQSNIVFIRGIDEVINNLPTFILQIDYYIFLIITWIGVSFMGLWGLGWWWGKSITELKAIKEKELTKENPDAELIAEIDKAIAKKETKGE